ncbi:MAG TPA: DUF4845 domain-containing protein [Gammaproteobacteria bacterium]|nr:DUF4845 domain-containing protein [Gammaproteobacteria bacterium]
MAVSTLSVLVTALNKWWICPRFPIKHNHGDFEMKGLHRQRGVTGITMILIMALIAFFSLIAMRLFPVYLEHFKVSSHLESLAVEESTGKLSDNEIRKTLAKRFDIDDVENVRPEDIFIERPDRDTLIIAIEYEVRTPAFGNVDMVISFIDEVEVNP